MGSGRRREESGLRGRREEGGMLAHIYTYICIYDMYIYIHVNIYIYIYTYIYK